MVAEVSRIVINVIIVHAIVNTSSNFHKTYYYYYYYYYYFIIIIFRSMSERRAILELGNLGRVPIDTLHELYFETRSGALLTFYQTRCSASIGGWVRRVFVMLPAFFELSSAY